MMWKCERQDIEMSLYLWSPRCPKNLKKYLNDRETNLKNEVQFLKRHSRPKRALDMTE